MSKEQAILIAEPTTTLLSDSLPPQLGIRGPHSPISALTSKGVEARRRLIAEGFKLKQDWFDAEHWRALAKKTHYRLPHWYIPLSTSKMEAVLHELGLGVEGNPPLEPRGLEVEFFPKEEVLHEKVKIYG